MIRFLLWGIFWLCTLCAFDIKATYADGLTVRYKSLWTLLWQKLRGPR